MSFKHVYVACCTLCKKENEYTEEKRIPCGWVGIKTQGGAEIKYMYKKNERKLEGGGVSSSISASCYIPEDSVFCSFDCFEKFMRERMVSTKNSMANDSK